MYHFECSGLSLPPVALFGPIEILLPPTQDSVIKERRAPQALDKSPVTADLSERVCSTRGQLSLGESLIKIPLPRTVTKVAKDLDGA